MRNKVDCQEVARIFNTLVLNKIPPPTANSAASLPTRFDSYSHLASTSLNSQARYRATCVGHSYLLHNLQIQAFRTANVRLD